MELGKIRLKNNRNGRLVCSVCLMNVLIDLFDDHFSFDLRSLRMKLGKFYARTLCFGHGDIISVILFK